ncbi:MAG: arsenite methyltransferase [Methanotrichaceae archaeon]|nr:arsenite methyltransferase [Methanotrichaceae archaeon]
MKEREIKRAVREGYAQIAKQAGSCCSVGGPCEATLSDDIYKRIGYSDEEIMAAPMASNLGLGCGNPLALASIKSGETVLDMGSGAGLDCFLASRKVGQKGFVIGIDMTSEMVERARANARKGNYTNIDFRQGELENMPVMDGIIDVVISNCVINLVPNKRSVFKEAYRVLKPGGRLMVSDIVLHRELPAAVKNSPEGYIGCLSGAVLKEEYLDAIRWAGFGDVRVEEEAAFPLDSLIKGLQEPAISKEGLSEMKSSVFSIKVSGTKPAT